MRRQKTRDTEPELRLRRLLHNRGLRYRVDYRPTRDIRRRADVVFTRTKVAVFVHGCFWHACPLHATQPKANAQWWADKLRRNVERDRETREALVARDWIVLEYWEHEDPAAAADEVEAVVRERGRRSHA
ncbi:DNA mismatch endonuclease Vsr [Kineococcus sp. R86509]|uniref:DNA mismatch endonuclease Vsr n=1 Tax=Kineococcus sp. R86509 TaxID=3093851 RepID=UPI0036D2C7C6